MFFCIATITWSLFSISAYTDASGAPPYLGITASGRPTDGTTIACGPTFPFGTRFLIDGVVKVCWDRGQGISDRHLDVWMESYEAAILYGRHDERVGVIQDGCQ